MIRQVLLFCFILILPLCAYPQQERTVKGSVIPSKGSFMTEIGIKPSSSKIIEFNRLQFKYGLSDRFFIRAGANYRKNRNYFYDDEYTRQMGNFYLKEKSDFYEVGLGLDFHILPKSKVSPYVGVEFYFSNKNSSAEYKDMVTEITALGHLTMVETTVLQGHWRELDEVYYENSTSLYYSRSVQYGNERAFRSFGSRLIFGTDFYFVRNFYFGFEMWFNIESLKYKSASIDITSDERSVTERTPSATSFRADFGLNSAIRVGFWF